MIGEHGTTGLRDFYEAFGTLHHVDQHDLGDTVVRKALANIGLPAHHANAVGRTDLDGELRASHHRGMSPVGELKRSRTRQLDFT
jgi:hypothetical protein